MKEVKWRVGSLDSRQMPANISGFTSMQAVNRQSTGANRIQLSKNPIDVLLQPQWVQTASTPSQKRRRQLKEWLTYLKNCEIELLD